MNNHLQLRIDEVPVGPNGPQGLLRMHWAKRKKYFDRWSWLIRKALGDGHHRHVYEGKCKVHIVQFRKRLLDTDNLYASTKPVLDGLREWAVIYDDSPKYCELIVAQEQAKDVCTHINVYYLA